MARVALTPRSEQLADLFTECPRDVDIVAFAEGGEPSVSRDPR